MDEEEIPSEEGGTQMAARDSSNLIPKVYDSAIHTNEPNVNMTAPKNTSPKYDNGPRTKPVKESQARGGKSWEDEGKPEVNAKSRQSDKPSEVTQMQGSLLSPEQERGHERTGRKARPNSVAAKQRPAGEKVSGFCEKMENYATSANMRRELRKEEAEFQAMRECTFVPDINPALSDCGGHRDFYSRQLKFSADSHSRIECVRAEFEQKAAREVRPAPIICPKSDQIFIKLSNRDDVPSRAYQRLYVHSQNQQQQQQEIRRKTPASKPSSPAPEIYRTKSPSAGRSEFTFHPKISPRAKEIKRSSSVEKMLYYDAMRRTRANASIKQEETKRYRSAANSKKTLENSEAWVARKFSQKFAAAWQKVLKDQDYIERESVQYEVLKELGFVKESKSEGDKLLCEKLWSLGSKQVSRRELEERLSMILNIRVASLEAEEDVAEAKRFQSFFWNLYLNYTQARRPARSPSVPSFTPTINQNSQIIASRMLSTQTQTQTCHERLLEKGQEYESKKREKEILQCQAVIDEFRPRKYTPGVCTEASILQMFESAFRTHVKSPRNIAQTATATKQKEKTKEMCVNPKDPVKAFPMKENTGGEGGKLQLLIEVKVNLGKGREEKLQVYDGQNVEAQLKGFANKNRIKKAAFDKLCTCVKQTIIKA